VTVSRLGHISVSHSLYQNLSTSLNLSGSQNILPQGTLSFYSGSVHQTYNHGLPRGGRLIANWSGSYQRNSNVLNSDTIPVLREPHAAPAEFAPGFLLLQPFVMVASVRVFNVTSGIPQLVSQSAYNIANEGSRTRITPVYLDLLGPNPVIKPDDLLQVDYSYQVDARLEYETRNLDYGFDVDYGWIGGGYQHQQSEEQPLTGESRFLTSSNTDTVNVRVSHSAIWLGVPVSMGASHAHSVSHESGGQEQEDVTHLNLVTSGRFLGMNAHGKANMDRLRGRQLGYDQLQMAAALSWQPETARWNMSFGANASNIHYLTPERQTSALSLQGSLNWDASGWSNSAFVEFRNTNDSLATRQTVWRLGGRSAFRMGKLGLYSGLYYDRMSNGAFSANHLSFDVSARRDFR